jgi:hypothetical protein
MQKVERVHEKLFEKWNGINNVTCHGLLHVVLIPNGHMPLGDE